MLAPVNFDDFGHCHYVPEGSDSLEEPVFTDGTGFPSCVTTIVSNCSAFTKFGRCATIIRPGLRRDCSDSVVSYLSPAFN